MQDVTVAGGETIRWRPQAASRTGKRRMPKHPPPAFASTASQVYAALEIKSLETPSAAARPLAPSHAFAGQRRCATSIRNKLLHPRQLRSHDFNSFGLWEGK